MNESKFRVYNKNTGQLCEVLLICFVNKYVDVLPKENLESGDQESWHFDCIHLMQFTGLSDKNGVEIYEGDIFQVAANKKYIVKYIESGTFNYELIAATFALWANDELFFPFDEYALKTGCVIGNIYTNPELLNP